MKHKTEVILANKAKCLACHTLLESTHVHDCKTCGCPNALMVDGGKEYIRRGYENRDLVEELSVIEEVFVDCSYYTWDTEKKECWRCKLEKRS